MLGSFGNATELEKFLIPARIETIMIWEAAVATVPKWKHVQRTAWEKERTCRTGTFTRYNISRGETIEQTNFEPAATPEIHRDITIESFINRT